MMKKRCIILYGKLKEIIKMKKAWNKFLKIKGKGYEKDIHKRRNTVSQYVHKMFSLMRWTDTNQSHTITLYYSPINMSCAASDSISWFTFSRRQLANVIINFKNAYMHPGWRGSLGGIILSQKVPGPFRVRAHT